MKETPDNNTNTFLGANCELNLTFFYYFNK